MKAESCTGSGFSQLAPPHAVLRSFPGKRTLLRPSASPQGIDIDPGVDFGAVTSRLEGYSGDDITNICRCGGGGAAVGPAGGGAFVWGGGRALVGAHDLGSTRQAKSCPNPNPPRAAHASNAATSGMRRAVKATPLTDSEDLTTQPYARPTPGTLR